MNKILLPIIFLVYIYCSSLAWGATISRVTVLYDAFGRHSGMTKDWGFAALIETGGKRILFDTGNNADIFAHNVKQADIDLTNLDFVVVSHRHLDHTAGINYLLKVNPDVKMYASAESFGVFGSELPGSFYRRDDSLPKDLQYYEGHPPEIMTFGTAWPKGNFEFVDKTTEILPGIHLISLVSDKPGTRELRELSMVVETDMGLIVIAGCSHPGIERIVEAATHIDERIHLVMGGFHMPVSSDEEIGRVANVLNEILHVDTLAPGHCTGEPAQAIFRKQWGEKHIYAGVGSVIELPAMTEPGSENTH